jgi:hypothetical protein
MGRTAERFSLRRPLPVGECCPVGRAAGPGQAAARRRAAAGEPPRGGDTTPRQEKPYPRAARLHY